MKTVHDRRVKAPDRGLTLCRPLRHLAHPSRSGTCPPKQFGFSDRQLAAACPDDTTEWDVREHRKGLGIVPAYKRVDTCAAEYPSSTPYLYSTYSGTEDETATDSGEKSDGPGLCATGRARAPRASSEHKWGRCAGEYAARART